MQTSRERAFQAGRRPLWVELLPNRDSKVEFPGTYKICPYLEIEAL